MESLLEGRKNLTVLSGRVRRDSCSCDKLTRDRIGVEKFGSGISRKQSQKVLLPVEMPPVIPIAGISGQCNFVFFARIRPRQHRAKNTVFAYWFMKIYEQPERNIQHLQGVHGGGSLHKDN